MNTSTRAAGAAHLAEKTILGFIAGAAAAIAVVDLVATATRAVHLMTADEVTVPGMSLADPQFDLPADVPAVQQAAVEGVTLVVQGLSISPRMLLAAADALGSIGVVSVCVAVAWLCLRTFIGRPFTTATTWTIGIAAIIVMGGGLLSPAVRANAHAEVVAELDLAAAGLQDFSLTLDLAPLGWGLALAVVAGAFEIGQRMQRDTEGLV